MKKIEFEFYDIDEFVSFIKNKLSEKEKVKFLTTISKIEENGIMIASRQKWTKKISGQINLLEIRSKFSSNIVRALYFKSKQNNKYVITNYFKKKTQKTPQVEIDKALSRKRIYEERNNSNEQNR